MKKRLWLIMPGALLLNLVAPTLAFSAFRGTDMWSNLVPGGSGGLADKHPISYYSLDYHVAGPSIGPGGVDAGDIPALVGQFLAWLGFTVVTFVMRLAISAFDWAYNVDVINGRHGALKPVGVATQDLWFSTFQPLLSTGVLVLGGWLVYKLSARKFGELGTGLIRAVLLTAVALAIIFNPAATIGNASSMSQDFASAIVGSDGADHMFETFIYKPWVVLEFGGLKHCVDMSHKDADGFPLAATNSTPNSAKRCRDHLRARDGYGGYAERFLRYPGGSKGRDREYQALLKGRVPAGNGPDGDLAGDIGIAEPSDPHQFDGYRVDKIDSPAVDMMQAQGAVQRLAFVFLLSLGIIAAILLLGMICFAALFTQLGLLVLLAITPVIVIAAIFPGMHWIFFAWAKGIGMLLVITVVYAIILRAALGISAGLMALGGTQGYLPAFAFQAALFVGLIAYRKKLAAPLTSHRAMNKGEQGAKGFVTTAAAAGVGAVVAPMAAAGKISSAGKDRLATITQQHAQDPNVQSSGAQPTPEEATGPRPDSTSPPASAGRTYSPNPVSEPDDPSTTVATMESQQQAQAPIREEDPVSIKSFREEYEQAKVDPRDEPAPERKPHVAKPLNGVGRPEPFDQALEQERAKTPSS